MPHPRHAAGAGAGGGRGACRARIYPSSHEISRELWIYSPDYFWRIFRVLDNGLVELARDGTILPLKSPAPQQPVTVPCYGAPAPVLPAARIPAISQPVPEGTSLSHPLPIAGEPVSPSEDDPLGEGSGPGNPCL
ncbi:MAG: hypothetical protein Q8N94_10305 [Methanoregula sp.]|nr:hypothetical protein [Methanoregula sp.]